MYGIALMEAFMRKDRLAQFKKRLLEKHLEYPVDYLPEHPTEFAGAD